MFSSYISLLKNAQVRKYCTLQYTQSDMQFTRHSVCLIKHHAIGGWWRYSATHSWPGHSKEVSCQLQALAALPPGNSPWYPLDRRLGGPQRRSGSGIEEKFPAPAGNWTLEHWSPSPLHSRYTDWAITALRYVLVYIRCALKRIVSFADSLMFLFRPTATNVPW
jgi:hypothetical protein